MTMRELVRLGRSLRALVLILPLLCATLTSADVASTATTRVVVPDLAGMLYPDQKLRVERYGTSVSASLLPTPLPVSDSSVNTALTTCPYLFCLDVVWVSDFGEDPFVLVSYESKLPVASSTLDGVSVASVRPVIEGTSGGGTSAAQTYWRFFSPQPNTQPPAIDLLFRLRQLSQVRSQKDQLLVHVNAKMLAPDTSTSAVETYVVYGNQRVQHTTTRVAANLVRLDLVITKNATLPDVVEEDGYPLIPIDVPAPPTDLWMLRGATCSECTALLYGCSTSDLASGACSYSTATKGLVACWRDVVTLNSGWFQSTLGNPIGSMVSINSWVDFCFRRFMQNEDNLDLQRPQREWWNSTAALNCLATYNCPFGPLQGVLTPPSPSKMLTLSSPTIYTYETTIIDDAFEGQLLLTFGESLASGGHSLQTGTISGAQSAETIRSTILSTLSSLKVGDVSVIKEKDPNNAWFFRVVITNLLFPDLMVRFQTVSTILTPSSRFDSFGSIQVTPFDGAKLQTIDVCASCAGELMTCQFDETCRTTVLPCLVTQLGTISQLPVQYMPQYAMFRVNIGSIFQTCITNVSAVSWSPVRRAILCVSRQRCEVGPTTVAADGQTYVGLQSGSQIIAVPANDDMVAFNVSGPSSVFPQNMPFDADFRFLAQFLDSFVLQNTADITVEGSVFVPDPSMRQLQLTYANAVLAANPSFLVEGLVALQNDPPQVYVEFREGATVSVEHLVSVMRSMLDSAPSAPPVSHPWVLRGNCLGCTASLYGCDPAQVSSGECYYNNASTPLGQCLRTQLPTSLYVGLLRDPNLIPTAETTAVITSQMIQCQQRALRQTGGGDTLVNRISMNSILSCFSMNACPFGPLELTQSNRMVQIRSSSYRHFVRLRTQTYQLTFVYKLGPHVLGNVFLNPSTLSQLSLQVQDVLSPTSIVATVTVQPEAANSEVFLDFQYDNVVVPDFTVQIADGSNPPRSMIEQMITKPTTRLVATPRDVSKVYNPSVENNTSTTPTPTPTPPTPTPVPNDNTTTTTPAPTIDRVALCSQCDTQHLSACIQSRFCREAMAPCLRAVFESQSFDQNVYVGEDFNIAPVLRQCANSPYGSPMKVFSDWWEPLQQWLTCYAEHACPISDGTNPNATTTLEFAPALVYFTLPTASVSWDGTFSVQVESLPGSSFHGGPNQVYNFVGTAEQLKDLLEHNSQGVAYNISYTVTPQNNDVTQFKFSMNAPFLDYDPNVVGPDVTPMNLAARLFMHSSVATSRASWQVLITKLTSVTQSSPPGSSCSECEQLYLAGCQDLSTCKGYLLDCIQRSLDTGDGSELMYGNDANIYSIFAGCSRGFQNSEWAPLQSFLKCYQDNQCPIDDGNSVYLRLRPAIDRFRYTPDMARMVARLQYPQGDYNEDLVAPLEQMSDLVDLDGVPQLRDALGSVVGSVGTVDLRTWSDPTYPASAGVKIAQLVYRGYFGRHLRLIPMNVDVITDQMPAFVVYTTGSLGSIQSAAGMLRSKLTQYMVVPQCENICNDYLSDCISGTSRASIYCRERILPCLSTELAASDLTFGLLSDNGRRLTLTHVLNGCANGAPEYALSSIRGYFACHARTGCSTNIPSRTVGEAQVDIEAGEQIIRLDSYGDQLQVAMPGNLQYTFTTIQPSVLNDLQGLRLFLADKVLNFTADVTVDAMSLPDSPQLALAFRYTNYGGTIPSVFGSGVTQLSRVDPKISFKFRSSRYRNWGRIRSLFSMYSSAYSSLQSSCNTCATQYLFSCPVCASSVIPCLVAKLEASPIDSGYAWTPYDATGVDFTLALRTCVQRLQLSEWYPLTQFFECYVTNGCAVSSSSIGSGDSSRSYLIVEPPSQVVVMPKDTPITITFTPPLGLPTTDPVSITNLPLDQLGFIAHSAAQMLTVSGHQPTVSVTMTETFFSAVSFGLRLVYKNFFWFVPQVAPTPAETTSYARFLINSMGNPTPSWAGLVDTLNQYASATVDPLPVLTGTCATCATKLYGCTADAIQDGSCSYKTSTNSFVSCLATYFTPRRFAESLSFYQGDFSVSIGFEFSRCFASVLETDELTNGASMTDDGWYKASEGLACFAQETCPFGPLEEATSVDRMYRLVGPTLSKEFTITSSFFSAEFLVTFGFREATSATITDTSSEQDMVTALKAVLPTSADVMVTIGPIDGSVGYTITVIVRHVYLPWWTFNLVTVQSTNAQTTGNFTGQFSLQTYDSSKVTTASPAPAPAPNPPGPAPAPAPGPARYLAESCVICGAQLFGCQDTAVMDGSCTYQTSTDPFTTCFISKISTSQYNSIVNTLDATLDVTTAISDCVDMVVAIDEASNAADHHDDLWYKATEGLACFEAGPCPMGPLYVGTGALTTDNMIAISASRVTKVFQIHGATFAGFFRATYGFRVLESTQFTDTSTLVDVEARIASVMPGSVDLMPPTMEFLSATSVWEITFDYGFVYYPGMQLTVIADVTVDDVSPAVSWSSQLTTVALQTTKIREP